MQEKTTLFLIRHAEAQHNILEKQARQKALKQAIEKGLSKEKTIERIEEARESILNKNSLFDAPLSEMGIKEARQAQHTLFDIIQKYNLRPPDEILVSPLTRTLETANLIFPYSPNVHVREELRERCTGKPPDISSSPLELVKRESFKRFSMRRLQDAAMMKELYNNNNNHDNNHNIRVGQQHEKEQEKEIATTTVVVENREMLRERTHKLFDLLAEASSSSSSSSSSLQQHQKNTTTKASISATTTTSSSSIAVVTHKGYLRELERGPFQIQDSAEFKNCEIRVYSIQWNSNHNDKNNDGDDDNNSNNRNFSLDLEYAQRLV